MLESLKTQSQTMENSLKISVVKQIYPQTHKWHLCTAVRDTFSFFTLGNCRIEFSWT